MRKYIKVRKRKWFCKTGSDVIDNLACKQNGVCWSCNLASRHRNVFRGIRYNYLESTATTKRYGYSVRFFRVLCSQTGRIRKNFKCSNYENRRIIRTRNYLNRLLKPLTRYLERATISLRGNCRRIREGYWFFWGVDYSAYCNDNKERGSWYAKSSTYLILNARILLRCVSRFIITRWAWLALQICYCTQNSSYELLNVRSGAAGTPLFRHLVLQMRSFSRARERILHFVTSLPVLQNHFRFLIFYIFPHLLNQTSFSCIGHLLANLNILDFYQASFNCVRHLLVLSDTFSL